MNKSSVIFPLGEKASADYFIGDAYASVLVNDDMVFNCPCYNVTFEPRSRNNWHKHAGGQILLVTSGIGYYQERGERAQIIKEGDVVKIAPNVEHWHGASHDSKMTHIAIGPNSDVGGVDWFDPVADEVYNQAQGIGNE
jgi:quercetin dioxygenase-like cupin family protein